MLLVVDYVFDVVVVVAILVVGWFARDRQSFRHSDDTRLVDTNIADEDIKKEKEYILFTLLFANTHKMEHIH